MATSPGIETPYFPQLMADRDLQRMLLARISAMNATLLSPENTIVLADSIYQLHKPDLERDHQSWKDRMNYPPPETSYSDMKTFLQARGSIVMEQLADRTGKSVELVTIEVPENAIGLMFINGLPLRPGRQKIQLFGGIEYRIELELEEDKKLISWSGSKEKGNAINFDPSKTRSIKPRIGK